MLLLSKKYFLRTTTFLFLLVARSISQPALSQSARLIVNDGGALSVVGIGKSDVLWEQFRIEETMAETYLFERDGVQYLVWQSFSSDKSLVAIPVIQGKEGPRFDRMYSFGRSVVESTRKQKDVRIGSEFHFSEALPLRGFSWTRVHELLGRVMKSRRGDPDQHIENPSSPGYVQTVLNSYLPDGQYKESRYYIDRDDSTWSITDTTCLLNCNRANEAASGSYTGGIGKWPIDLSLDVKAPLVVGSYKYCSKKSSGKLYLRGSIDDHGTLLMTEYSDESATNITGKFSAKLDRGVWRGTWTSGDKARTLSFFATPSSF